MISWIQRTLSHAGEPSTKRHIVAIASISLCGITLMIGVACAMWIRAHGDLGSGAAAALTFVSGITAGLAGNAYRKKDASSVPVPGGADKSGEAP
jgi:hypothetical protein